MATCWERLLFLVLLLVLLSPGESKPQVLSSESFSVFGQSTDLSPTGTTSASANPSAALSIIESAVSSDGSDPQNTDASLSEFNGLLTDSTLAMLSTSMALSSTSSTNNVSSARSCAHTAAASKRWYGVEKPDDSTNKQQEGRSFPWPVKCGPPNSVQPLRYCFKDQRSADNLIDIVNHAIARWAPAMQDHVSALSIDLDQGTGGDHHVYCSDSRVSGDALVISDETKDDNEQWNWEECDTQTTTGYDYSSNTRGRHTLEFCHLLPNQKEKTTPYAIRAMMHELGHAIGLQHEHQRPDSNQYLGYNPEHLLGYEQGVKDAENDQECLFPEDMTKDDKILLMTQDASVAKQYFPQALPFIRGNNMEDERWSHYVQSTDFDYQSIMMYSSDSNTIAPNEYVIWNKLTNAPVYMGGDPDVTKASISVGDVVRVAQLYPSETDQGKAMAGKAAWQQGKALRVKVRGVFETVVFAPNLTRHF